jgi:hypothetical protein
MGLGKIKRFSQDNSEEFIILKPKYQAVLSIVAHFQHNEKNLQRAHLIRALVKNTDSNQEKTVHEVNGKKKRKESKKHWYSHRTKTPQVDAIDGDLSEKDTIDQLQTLHDVAPKIMFNSIANLDKTVAQLRKLGLITNQYVRGYPRIILTEKGRMFFYSFVYTGFIFKTITDLINNFH